MSSFPEKSYETCKEKVNEVWSMHQKEKEAIKMAYESDQMSYLTNTSKYTLHIFKEGEKTKHNLTSKMRYDDNGSSKRQNYRKRT